jgi:hypothetical protein
MAWKSFPKNLKESSKINSLHSIKKKVLPFHKNLLFHPSWKQKAGESGH